ncbi:hypothetical protein ACSSUR_24415 [Pseudomonas cedrina]|uniref:hypothetical protein n=1 Tax=Pseudomonas cedrina TaxID=651740 RepID=UPI003EDB595E
MSDRDAPKDKAVEERAAWDQYAAAFVTGTIAGKNYQGPADSFAESAAVFANAMLRQRRATFD